MSLQKDIKTITHIFMYHRFYPLPVVQADSNESTERHLRAIKRDFRCPRMLMNSAGVQYLFSGTQGYWEDWKNPSDKYMAKMQMPLQEFWLFRPRTSLLSSWPSAVGEIHLGQGDKRILSQELSGLINKALNWVWKSKGVLVNPSIKSCRIA